LPFTLQLPPLRRPAACFPTINPHFVVLVFLSDSELTEIASARPCYLYEAEADCHNVDKKIVFFKIFLIFFGILVFPPVYGL
jgi:hypothetical protein